MRYGVAADSDQLEIVKKLYDNDTISPDDYLIGFASLETLTWLKNEKKLKVTAHTLSAANLYVSSLQSKLLESSQLDRKAYETIIEKRKSVVNYIQSNL